jgi:hypothetical protein
MGAENEFSVFFNEDQKRDILMGVSGGAKVCHGSGVMVSLRAE